jgi:hypothetical protein
MVSAAFIGRAKWACLGVAVAALVIGCGGGGAPAPRPNIREKRIASPPVAPKATITTLKDEPEPFRATSGPGDAAVAFVRDEKSSRLDVPLPRGKAREVWQVPLHGPRREPCHSACPPGKRTFVLAAGNRVAVTGPEDWVLFDTSGRRVGEGKTEGRDVRIDRVSGAVVVDETRSPDLPPDAWVAAHDRIVVSAKGGGVYVGEREIEGRFDAYGVAIDENGVACVPVRQGDQLSMWMIPLGTNGSIGRHKIPGRATKVLGPPVLGKRLRVLVVETGIIALGLDGKRIWERRGVPSGGISITSDDHVLVADQSQVIAIDPRGRATEIWSGGDVVLVSPPIVNATGLLLVASAEALHAIAFS